MAHARDYGQSVSPNRTCARLGLTDWRNPAHARAESPIRVEGFIDTLQRGSDYPLSAIFFPSKKEITAWKENGRHTYRHTHTQTDRQRHVKTHIHTDRQTKRKTDRQTQRKTNTQTDTQTDTQPDRQTETQTDRHTDTRGRL